MAWERTLSHERCRVAGRAVLWYKLPQACHNLTCSDTTCCPLCWWLSTTVGGFLAGCISSLLHEGHQGLINQHDADRFLSCGVWIPFNFSSSQFSLWSLGIKEGGWCLALKELMHHPERRPGSFLRHPPPRLLVTISYSCCWSGPFFCVFPLFTCGIVMLEQVEAQVMSQSR
ncbi:hypothetical protein DL93DRAFT_575966 [Clavulina sp. PMI_390]|nr:hypothetical protein DL93DRAFT_575966 [Clavulina sp. PMI_390]